MISPELATAAANSSYVFVDPTEQYDMYPRFTDMMAKWGYDWEAIRVTTDDDYILSTFHILGKTGEARPTTSEGSVLIQHGDYEDGTSMMSEFVGEPFHLLLVDAGYDVWIGNNRGTMYSWDHVSLDSATDPEYWDWSWAHMGLYDDTANITAIREIADVPKMFYIGYSQGTMQMHYGLVHLEDTFHVNNLYRVVSLAPCFVPHVPNWTHDFANRTIMQFQANGIYSINGPNWDIELERICTNFPGIFCTYYTNNTGAQGQSVTSEQHWVMDGLTDRFQEFADEWLEGVEETALVDVSLIDKVPMSFFTATRDQTCPHRIAGKYIPQVQSEHVQIDVVGENHQYFHTRANSDWFMENLIAQLQIPASETKVEPVTI